MLDRMNYILMLFIVAAVGIARIAIEEGRGRATVFAMALGAATLVSISTFIGQGLPLAVALLALIWYLADRITIDCTVIDEQQDASGEGLLNGGLFGSAAATEQRDVTLDGTTESPSDDIDIVTAELVEDADSANPDAISAKRRKRKRKEHRPGMWILYLAIAAIPLYGLGQVMIPDSVAAQNSAMKSLAIYLGSSLMLLVSTSFLGMRRYLRQRGVDMPTGISINWLGVGALLVVALLLACFMLPLPGKMLASVDFEAMKGAEDLSPSQWGWGDEGVKSDDSDVPKASKGEEPAPNQPAGDAKGKGEAKPGGDGGTKGANGKGKGGKDDPKGKQPGGDKQGEKAGASKSQGNKEQSKSQSEKGEKGQSQRRKQGDRQGEKQQAKQPNDDAADSQDTGKHASDDRSESEQSRDDSQSKQKLESSEDEGGSASETPPPTGASPQLPDWLPELSGILRFLIFAGLVGIVAVYVIRHWDELSAWLTALLGLGGKDIDDDELLEELESTPSRRERSFAEFRNPLEDGSTMEQSVIVTFAAFEAWSREHGCRRNDIATPSEFANRAAREFPEQHRNISLLADMYNLVVYGSRRVNPAHKQTLQSIWEFMVRNPVAYAAEEPVLTASDTSGLAESEPTAGEPAQRWKT